jgi:hypothetical protein
MFDFRRGFGVCVAVGMSPDVADRSQWRVRPVRAVNPQHALSSNCLTATI